MRVVVLSLVIALLIGAGVSIAGAGAPTCKVYTTRTLREIHTVVDVRYDSDLCTRAAVFGTSRKTCNKPSRRQICRWDAGQHEYHCTDVCPWPSSIRIRRRPARP